MALKDIILEKVEDVFGPGTTTTMRELKTQAYVLLIEQITGTAPIVKRFTTYNQIDFTAEQKVKLTAYIERQMKREPTDVRINVQPILNPIILKRMWVWIAGGTLLGFLGGKFIKRKRIAK